MKAYGGGKIEQNFARQVSTEHVAYVVAKMVKLVRAYFYVYFSNI